MRAVDAGDKHLVDPLRAQHRREPGLGAQVGTGLTPSSASQRLCAAIRAGLTSARPTSSAVPAWSSASARTNISARAPAPTNA
nr:hypothetical protein GCM10020092_046310 [Actinoplanes digitatis]